MAAPNLSTIPDPIDDAPKRRRHRMPRPPLPERRNGRLAEAAAQDEKVIGDGTSGLQLLLAIEEETRRAGSVSELCLLIANETRKLTHARQVFVLRGGDRLRMVAISGLPKMNRNTPLVQDIERRLAEERKAKLDPEDLTFVLKDHSFPQFLWQPMRRRDGHQIGGVLLAREQGWEPSDKAIVARLGATYAHAMAALEQDRPRLLSSRWRDLFSKRRRIIALAFGLTMLAMALPISMSALAPVEVAAHNPFIVAAPLDGVVEEILVNPGDEVITNQPLVRMAGQELRNKLDVAERAVMVAEARLKKANQMAFSNADGASELRTAMADLDLKRAELGYARNLYERSVIRAERTGVAVLSDKQAMIGKPVVTGERIMQIANPGQIDIQIQLPVRDALVLKPDAQVRVFLDSDPLNSREARIVFGDYQALPGRGDQLAFRLVAELVDKEGPKPRLGVRGTARIYGDHTLLGLYLFRRPLAAARQWLGL